MNSGLNEIFSKGKAEIPCSSTMEGISELGSYTFYCLKERKSGSVKKNWKEKKKRKKRRFLDNTVGIKQFY